MTFVPNKLLFKNASGVHMLKPIFYELDDSEKVWAQYSLKDYDHIVDGKIYPSIRKLYVDFEDPTEYDFACTYFDNWNHWTKMTQASFFQSYLKEMREELDVKLRARSLSKIKQTAESDGKDSLQANKFLIQGGWKTPVEKSQVGRPTKQKIKEEAEKLFNQRTEFDDDFERVLGSVIQ